MSINQETIIKWGVDQGIYHHYRVLGQHQPVDLSLPYNPVDSGDGWQNYMIVMARNLNEVCEKLSASGWVFPVLSVVRYDPPARRSDWDEDYEDCEDCRKMVDVTSEFFQTANCYELIITEDITEEAPLLAEVYLSPTYIEQDSSGSLLLSGSSSLVVTYNPSGLFTYTTRGGMELGGEVSDIVAPAWAYTSSGSLSLGGSSLGDYNYEYSADGQLILGGSSEAIIVGTEDLYIKASDATTTIVQANYAPIEAEETFEEEESFVQTLCCSENNVSSLLYLFHEFDKESDFSNFMKYNGLVIPNTFKLVYRDADEMWQGNYNYSGQSVSNDGNANWSLSFEFGCVNPSFGSTDLSGSADYWKLGVLFNFKNTTTGYDAKTRVLLFFDKDYICEGSTAFSNFGVQFNTYTLVSDPITVLDPVLYDGANLFKSYVWKNDPILNLEVSSLTSTEDLSTVYPELKTPIGEVRGSSPTSNI